MSLSTIYREKERENKIDGEFNNVVVKCFTSLLLVKYIPI